MVWNVNMFQFISAGKTEALRVSVPLNRMDMSDQEERGGNASPQPSLPSGIEELARERKIWVSLPTLLP